MIDTQKLRYGDLETLKAMLSERYVIVGFARVGRADREPETLKPPDRHLTETLESRCYTGKIWVNAHNTDKF